jgi:hypothetical protein
MYEWSDTVGGGGDRVRSAFVSLKHVIKREKAASEQHEQRDVTSDL